MLEFTQGNNKLHISKAYLTVPNLLKTNLTTFIFIHTRAILPRFRTAPCKYRQIAKKKFLGETEYLYV